MQAAQNCGDKRPFFTVISAAEFHECKEQLPYYKELHHCLRSIRYCKAEVFKNCIIGTLRLPQKSEQRSPQLSFSFYLTGQSLLFVENVGDLKLLVEKRISMFQELNSPSQLLLQFMEQMIEDDVLYLSHIESEIEKMEENIGSGGSANFFPLLTKHRQKLSELNAYYEQLTDIGSCFNPARVLHFQTIHRTGINLSTVPRDCKIMFSCFVKICFNFVSFISLGRMRGKIRLWGFSQSSPPFSCLLL